MIFFLRFILFNLFLFITPIASVAFAGNFHPEFNDFGNETLINAEAPGDTITGSTSFCKNTPSAEITFEGSSGKAPYTFTYEIDGILQPVTPPTGSGNTIQVKVNTSSAKVLIYKILSIKDAEGIEKKLDISRTITVNDLPTVSFSIDNDNPCSGTIIHFSTSLSSSYTYAWNFNDSSASPTSTLSNPQHIFISTGNGTETFNVILTVTDKLTTCQNTISKNVTVKQAPDAALNGTGSGNLYNGIPLFKNCTNSVSTFTFTNASTTSTSNKKYKISWGDGSPDIEQASWSSTSHTYQIGLWNLIYTIEGSNGCSISKPFIVFVGSNPAVSLGNPGNTDVCISESLTFPITGTTNNPPGTIYTITFNDGPSSQTFNHPPPSTVTHRFLKTSCGTTSSDGSSNYPNSFYAKIVAENPCATSAVSVVPIHISTPPVAEFNLQSNSICTNIQTCFTNTSIGANEINGNTCDDTPNIIWIISPNTGVTLVSGSLGNDFGSTDQGLWMTGSNAICPKFSITGTYTITMVAANKCGTTQKIKTLCVEPPTTPQFSLDKTQGCIPLTVKATNNTNVANSCSSISYRWETTYVSSNCGTNSGVTFDETTTNPIFNFTEPGKYTIKLTVINSCSNNQTTTQTVTVSKPPTVSINQIANFCGSALITPIAVVNSCGSASSSLSYAWSFPGGNPESSTSINPGTITYIKDGTYTVSLNVTNDCGVSTTATRSFVVKQIPVITNTSLAQTICSGLKTELVTLTSNLPNATYLWTASGTPGITGFTASGNTNTLPILSIFNSNSSIGTVIYSITPSLGGCTGEMVKYIVTVNPSAAVTFSPTNQIICSGENTAEVTLNSTTAGAVFSWTAIQPAGIIGLITSGTNTIPAQTLINSTNAPILVTYKAKATIIGATSCAGVEYSYTITVNPKPAVSGTIAQTICSGDPFSFLPTNLGGNIIPAGTKYTWTSPIIIPAGTLTGASGQTTSQTTISQILVNTTSAIATATYSVTPETNGCKGSSFDIIVSVNPKATVNPVTNVILCNNDLNPGIIFSGNIPGVVYKWTSNNTSIGIAGSGSDQIPAFTVANLGTSPVVATISVSPVFENGSISCNDNPLKFTITVNPSGQFNNPGNLNVCNGRAASVNFSSKNTGGTTTYEWTNSVANLGLGASGTGNISFTPINSGNTILTTTITVVPIYTNNGSSCKGPSEQFTINVNPIPTVDQPPDQIVCNGYQTSEIKFSGNILNSTYNWSINNTSIGLSATGTGDISPFAAKNSGTNPVVATITVTPSLNGCTGLPKSFKITVNPSPLITNQPTTSTVCLGANPIVLLVSTSNGVGTPTYQWYSNTSNSTTGSTLIPNETRSSYNPPSLLANTMYYYCVITFPTGGCNTLTSEIAKVTINQKPVISTINKEISSGEVFTVIPNSLNGDIVPTGTTYKWLVPVITPANSASGASAQSAPQTSISQILTNTTNGIATVTYTVTPTSGSCVGATFQVIVKVNPPLFPNATLNSVTCFGVHDGSIITDIKGGVPFSSGSSYTVLWTGPNGFTSDSPSISGLYPGVYQLDIIDSVGMKFSAIYTITEPNDITVVTNTEKNVTCFGAANGEIAISTSGGTKAYNYTWTKDQVAYATTEDIANLSPGAYEVKVTDANNCVPKILTYTISEPAALAISLQNKTDIKCFGESTGAVSVDVQGGKLIEVTPGIFDYKYAWTGPGSFTSSDKNLNNVRAGNYNISVTDDSGCSQVFPVVITEPAQIVILANKTPISCYGANDASIQLTISGGVSPYQTQWDNFAIGTFQDNLSAGNYSITVTDANNCQKEIQVNIPEASLFKVSPVVKNITCFGAHDGSIALNYEGEKESIIFSWSDNSTSGSTRNNIGPGTYTVNIKGGNLCLINRTFIIVEPLPLVLNANITNVLDCTKESGGAIDLSVTGGKSPYVYAWMNGAKTKNLTNIPAGNYAVTVTDSIGCVQTSQFAVKRPSPIEINVTTKNDYDCASKIIKEVSTARVTGGVPPFQLKWSTGTVSGANNEIMETNQSGTVVLTATDALGCIAENTFSVSVPNLGVDYQLLNCDLHIHQFNAVVVNELDQYTYSWDFGDGASSNIKNPQHTYQTAGIYKVRLTVTDSSTSCKSEYEQTINAEFPPEVSIDRIPKFCEGDSILIHAKGAFAYRWNNGTTADSMVINNTGEYSVTGFSKAGCTAKVNFTASYFDLLNYTIQSDKTEVTTDGNQLHLWTENIPFSNYIWDFGDGTNGTGYDLIHTYENLKDGYFDVKLKVINPTGCIEEATKRIWVSILSIPNTFTPNGDDINDIYLKDWNIKVYNRNGILIYEGKDGWDGNYNGKPVASDTYFVIVYYSSETGTKYKTNYITVLR